MFSLLSPILFLFLSLFSTLLFGDNLQQKKAKVLVGAEVLFTPPYVSLLEGKKVGLITNHTAVNSASLTTIDLIKSQAEKYQYRLTALYAPEHGLNGGSHASESIENQTDPDGIPIYSLHGETRRPTKQMLSNINVLLFDIQDIGSRSYTYISTLFYAMEEAAKSNILVLVLDRPNPLNGLIVDGPMLETKWRSFVGYANVPYCHGMTVGELALFFNDIYQIGCPLKVIPMKGWRREMSFRDTGLTWIPTSPHIPEPETVFYYPTTGIIGELDLVSIGVGYTLPFKILGAPWIDAKVFSEKLNQQNFPGVYFHPFYFKPFYGKFSGEDCQGVLIVITDPKIYKPVSTQFLLLGILKSLYPKKFKLALNKISKSKKEMFCKVNGTEKILTVLQEKPYIVWSLQEIDKKEREGFNILRKRYLIPSYGQ